MWKLVIKFTGMCLFTPREFEGQHCTDVSLLRSDSDGKFLHDPQLSIIEGMASNRPLPIMLDGYDITILDGDEATKPGDPHEFTNAVPLSLVLCQNEIRDGILWDGYTKDRVCAARMRLRGGCVTPYADTGDEWELVRNEPSAHNDCPIKSSARVVTTEFAYELEIQSDFATFRLHSDTGQPQIDLTVRPVRSDAKHATVVIANPDREGVRMRKEDEINRSPDFPMVFAILKPDANYIRCELEQVRAEPLQAQSNRKTLHIPCVPGCTIC